jgi:uroporphyrin-III C-methyltransferase/precorrin-2 dehydrogenase/sirohydrochlorin ferrochelatase
VNAASHYPVFLDLRGRGCVVLGDTEIAVEKADGLRTAGARVAHHRRGFVEGDLVGACLAVDASGDPAAQASARLEADRERVLLNVVDVASQCDWIAPAVVRRGPLQMAISTSGESPFLATHLRQRLEKEFGPEWGPLTVLMGRLRRRLRRHGVAMERQQRAYGQLLRSDALELLADSPTDAELLAAGIESEARRPTPVARTGQVVLVGAGPGDPGLLTLAGRAALLNADVVLHDALVPADLLRMCGASARLIDVGKRGGRRSTPQEKITATLLAEARAGNSVVRLKGGDPFIFGRGGEEVAALAAAGVPVRVIPGISSVLAAPAAAGIPLTFRGVAASVAVVAGHRVGDGDDSIERLAAQADTLVVLMPGDLRQLTARLTRVVGADRPAALVSSATTASQLVARAPLGHLASAARAHGLVAPLTLIVGDVVDVLSEMNPAAPCRAVVRDGGLAVPGAPSRRHGLSRSGINHRSRWLNG